MADLLSSIGDWITNNPGVVASIGIGGLLGSADGSTQSGTSTSTQAPWQPQQDYLLDLFSRAKQMADQSPTSPYTNLALQGMQGFAQSPLSPQAQGVISNTLGMNPANYFGIGTRNQFMGQSNPYIGQTTAAGSNPLLGVNNPYLQSSIDAASQDAMRNLNSSYISSDRGSGSFGNSGLGETYARTAAQTLGNIATNARMQDYQNQQGLYENQVNRNLQNDQYNLTQGGNWWNNDITRNANLDQTGITNDLGQYNQGTSVLNNAAFNAPGFNSTNLGNYAQLYNAGATDLANQWKPLQNYGSLIGGGYGGTSSTPIYSNPYSGALGGGLLGSQIYSNIFSG